MSKTNLLSPANKEAAHKANRLFAEVVVKRAHLERASKEEKLAIWKDINRMEKEAKQLLREAYACDSRYVHELQYMSHLRHRPTIGHYHMYVHEWAYEHPLEDIIAQLPSIEEAFIELYTDKANRRGWL